MTLDEAIKKAEKIAEEKFNNAVYIMDKMKSDVALKNAEECKRFSEEHRQLAEWLKDYKRLKEQEPCENAISRQAWNLCDSCINGDCIFQSGIVRKHCDFYKGVRNE